MEASGNFSAASGKRPLLAFFAAESKVREGPRRYCRPGVLFVNPARRNASAIASPLADPGLLEPAPVSPGSKTSTMAAHGCAAAQRGVSKLLVPEGGLLTAASSPVVKKAVLGPRTTGIWL